MLCLSATPLVSAEAGLLVGFHAFNGTKAPLIDRAEYEAPGMLGWLTSDIATLATGGCSDPDYGCGIPIRPPTPTPPPPGGDGAAVVRTYPNYHSTVSFLITNNSGFSIPLDRLGFRAAGPVSGGVGNQPLELRCCPTGDWNTGIPLAIPTLQLFAPTAGNSYQDYCLSLAGTTLANSETLAFVFRTAGDRIGDVALIDNLAIIGLTDPYPAWAASNAVTGGKAGDDDGDGVLNLLEFATNSDAKSASSQARVHPLMQLLDGVEVLTYTVAVRKSTLFAAAPAPNQMKQTATNDWVVYTVEASTDLSTWNGVEVTEVTGADAAAVRSALGATLSSPPLGACWEWHTFRTAGSAGVDPIHFIRLKVTAAQ